MPYKDKVKRSAESPFQQFLDLGWALCSIPPGTKGPRQKGWQRRENALTSLDGVVGAGLMHAYSQTCAIDIDDMEKSAAYLHQHGIDLNVLLNEPGAVRIHSGRQGRAKLLYKLKTPLPTIRVADNKLEFRCATVDGLSVQDVLPNTIHPDTGQPYTMTGEPALMAEIPAKLLAIWKENLTIPTPKTEISTQSVNEVSAELRRLVLKQDPNLIYQDWFNIGAIIHHETGGSAAGFKLWDEWSRGAKEKYRGPEDLKSHWDTMGRSPRPLTLDYLRHAEPADASEFAVINEADIPADFMEAGKRPNPFLGQFLEPKDWGTLPPPDWMIPNLVPKYGLGSIYGAPGSGKSFLGIDIALEIATGGLWRGMRLKQGTVVVIAAENAHGYRIRTQAGLAARNAINAPMKVLGMTPRLNDKKQLDWLHEAIQEFGDIALIIVDTMAASTPGMNENETAEVTEFLYQFRTRVHNPLKATSLFMHHTGKDASRGARGSSAFKADFDMEWEVDRDEGNPVRNLVIHKVRDAEDRDENGHKIKFPFQLQKVGSSAFVEWI